MLRDSNGIDAFIQRADSSNLSRQQPADFGGALTLLRDCVGGCEGQRLLIVSEPESTGFYDDQAPKLTAAAARSLGMRVYLSLIHI